MNKARNLFFLMLSVLVLGFLAYCLQSDGIGRFLLRHGIYRVSSDDDRSLAPGDSLQADRLWLVCRDYSNACYELVSDSLLSHAQMLRVAGRLTDASRVIFRFDREPAGAAVFGEVRDGVFYLPPHAPQSADEVERKFHKARSEEIDLRLDELLSQLDGLDTLGHRFGDDLLNTVRADRYDRMGMLLCGLEADCAPYALQKTRLDSLSNHLRQHQRVNFPQMRALHLAEVRRQSAGRPVEFFHSRRTMLVSSRSLADPALADYAYREYAPYLLRLRFDTLILSWDPEQPATVFDLGALPDSVLMSDPFFMDGLPGF